MRFVFKDDAPRAFQRSLLDGDAPANLEVVPRSRRKPGEDHALQRFHLVIINGDRGFTHADDRDDPWHVKNGEPVLQVEAAEDVAGEEWLVDALAPVRPAPARCDEREER